MKKFLLEPEVQSKVAIKRRIRISQILNALKDVGTLSHAQLARITHFSLPMISDLTQELHRENIVIPVTPSELKVGRPPNSLTINPEAGYIIGVDVGHTNSKLVIINILQKIILERSIPTVALNDADNLLKNLKNYITDIKNESGISQDKFLGIGFAIPGLVNSQTGQSFSYLNFKGENTKSVIERIFNLPVRIENDVKAMALGEIGFGQAKNHKNVACINLGWGVGMGLILNGQIYYGKSGFAGEFGHINIVDNGELCVCGLRGCLETVASGRAIGEIARKRLANGEQSQLANAYSSPDEIDAESVVKFARKGDQFCIELLQEAGHYLGKSIGEIINLFNPELIILGGRGSEAGEFILHPIRTAALRYSLVELGLDTQILYSNLGAKSGCLGATMLFTQEIYDTSHINLGMFV